MSFEDFCGAISHVPDDYAFFAPFTGLLPSGNVVVRSPVSSGSGSQYHRYDIDSAHLVGPAIPVSGKLALFTQVDVNFVIKGRLHHKFTLEGFEDPVELHKIANFRIGCFGLGSCWNVSMATDNYSNS